MENLFTGYSDNLNLSRESLENINLSWKIEKILLNHWLDKEKISDISKDILFIEDDLKNKVSELLEYSNDLLDFIIEKLPFPVSRYNRDWKILNWNNNMEILTWYSKEEIIDFQSNWWNLIELFYWYDDKEIKAVESYVSLLKEWESYEDTPFYLKNKYNKIKHTFWNSFYLSDWTNLRLMLKEENPNENILMEKKIKEEEKMKEKISNQEDIISLLLSKSNIASVRYDENWKVLDWNEKMEEITWYNIYYLQRYQDNWGDLMELFYWYDEKEIKAVKNFLSSLEEWSSYENVLFNLKSKNWDILKTIWSSFSLPWGWSIRIITEIL